VVLVDWQPRQPWLRQAVEKRLGEELAKLLVEGMRRSAVRWTCSEARVTDFWGWSSVVFGVAGDDGCRCDCRKARSGRLC